MDFVLEIRQSAGHVTFLVRVQPRASRSELAGEWQGALRVRLAAPPLEDRANEALRRFLAARLNVPVAAVRIARGERSRNKRVEISGATVEQVRAMAALSAGQTAPTSKIKTSKVQTAKQGTGKPCPRLKPFRLSCDPPASMAGSSTIFTTATRLPREFSASKTAWARAAGSI